MASISTRPTAYVAFQVRILPELKERLARRSYETGVSQSSIVIAALQYYLELELAQEDEVAESSDED